MRARVGVERTQKVGSARLAVVVALVRTALYLAVLGLFAVELVWFPAEAGPLGCWLQARAQGSVDGQPADELQLSLKLNHAQLFLLTGAEKWRTFHTRLRLGATCTTTAACPAGAYCAEGVCGRMQYDFELMQARRVDEAAQFLVRLDSVGFAGNWGRLTSLAVTLRLDHLLRAMRVEPGSEGTLALAWDVRCFYSLFCRVTRRQTFFPHPHSLAASLGEERLTFSGLLLAAECRLSRVRVDVTTLGALVFPLFVGQRALADLVRFWFSL